MDSLEITINAADGERAAEFWCAALDYRIRYRRAPYLVLGPAEGTGPQLVVQTVGTGGGPGGVHLDLRVDRREETVARLAARGAQVQHEITEAGRTWTVMLDPEGNEFCVCPARTG